MSTEEQRTQIAEILGLQKGGISASQNAPAQNHWYLKNDVRDWETEKRIMNQFINFEERIDSLVDWHQATVREEVLKFAEELKELSWFDEPEWYTHTLKEMPIAREYNPIGMNPSVDYSLGEIIDYLTGRYQHSGGKENE